MPHVGDVGEGRGENEIKALRKNVGEGGCDGIATYEDNKPCGEA